ncbi:hypothetical protein DRO33_01615 [Candidatus Bathyarchaeota archaeon]|nr:MAG: hypothetical protein DRO33_01615 [Candidatus Bathyarchaeota archaeon]
MTGRLKLPEAALTEIYRCFRCGYCRSACPTFAVTGSESWNARGRLLLARALLEGQLEPTPGLLDRLFSCNSCLACEAVCPAVVEVVDALVALKEALITSGAELPDRIARLAEAVVEQGSPFASGAREFTAQGERPADVLVFAGCVASELEPDIIRALEKLLDAAGLSYSVLEGPCCGLPLLKMGFRHRAAEAARRLADKLRAAGAELVITPCPMCFEMLLHYLPRLVGLNVRAEHVSIFLKRLLREGKLVLKRKVELKATYHDPCVLGRGLGIYEAPRELIWQAGLALVEMPRSKRSSVCCGYGHLNFLAYPELVDAIAEERVKEALAAGADVLITACPSCLHALSGAARRVARALAVSDITEVLAELV